MFWTWDVLWAYRNRLVRHCGGLVEDFVAYKAWRVCFLTWIKAHCELRGLQSYGGLYIGKDPDKKQIEQSNVLMAFKDLATSKHPFVFVVLCSFSFQTSEKLKNIWLHLELYLWLLCFFFSNQSMWKLVNSFGAINWTHYHVCPR